MSATGYCRATILRGTWRHACRRRVKDGQDYCWQHAPSTPAHTFIPLSGSQGPDGRYQRCGVDGCMVAPEHHRRVSSTAAEDQP